MVWCFGKMVPVFVNKGTGGFFKGKDPNVAIKILQEKWVKGSPLLYVGKAADLNSRICQYVRFGQGSAVGHYGGRYIWQIKDLEKLWISWEELKSETEAINKERQILRDYKNRHLKLPFANLKCG